jgi:hypothetical protein
MKGSEDKLLSRADKRKKARRRRRGPYRKAWSPKAT